MKDCAKCGGEVRLGAYKVSVNRKRGVANYVDHMNRTDCDGTDGFTCVAMKPYKKPSEGQKLIERWNDEQNNRASRPLA